MPRVSRGPFLYQRKRKNGATTWYVRDGNKHIATGCSADDSKGAQLFLAELVFRDLSRSQTKAAAPVDFQIIDALVLYSEEKGKKQKRPGEVGQRLTRLLEFFDMRTCDEVTPSLCKSYERWRTHGGVPGKDEPPRTRAAVKVGTVRRELEDLRAALRYAWKSRKLSHEIPVTLPEKSASRERWLTPAEARRLVLGARGCVFKEVDGQWKIARRERDARMTVDPLVRFILIGLRTGTRHDAIMRLGFRPHADGGHFDLEKRRLYRRAPGTKETTKRQPPAPIPAKLLVLLRYWKARSNRLLVVDPNEETKKTVTRRRIDDPFRRAVRNAGLGSDVTPHTLRHTCATWKVQAGVPIWQVAGFLGMTAEMVDRVYGHHAPDHLSEAADA